ncbi:MAG: hypothetical protein JXA07_16180 [Spirochaetes bacterium]|nr:hypothetical protein [Spirochaetota bacterium]
MKYTVVKQFSNGFIDNIFNFIFKWADCGKMFLEFLWSFLDIWIAFFLIFYNAFMYVYYLFLFFIDRGAESSAGYFRLRGSYAGTSTIPKFEMTRSGGSVPPQYGKQAVSRAAESVAARTGDAAGAAAQTFSNLRSSAARGIKKSVIKEFFNALVDFFRSLGKALVAPFKKLVLLFDRGAELRKQREAAKSEESKSLIDEYMKEYEKKRR